MLQRLAVHRPQPRRRVADALADEQRDDCREDTNPDAPEPRAPIAATLDEARADHEIGPAVEDRLEHLCDLARVVLTVAVHLDRNVKPTLERVLVARLDGTPDPDVEGQRDDSRAGSCGTSRGGVRRTVVDDDDIELGIGGADLLEDRPQRTFLVKGRDYGDRPNPRRVRRARPRDGYLLRHSPAA